MTKRTITKLFAVAVLAAGGTASASTADDPPPQPQQARAKPIKPRALPNGKAACGNTMDKTGASHPKYCGDDIAVPVVVTAPTPPVAKPVVIVTPVSLAPATRQVLRLFGITTKTRAIEPARPRELRNGKPANGNIPSRRAAPVEREVERPRVQDEN